MRVGILGATGLIGRYLATALELRGDDIVTASLRDPESAATQTAHCDVIVNVSGEPIAQRWTPAAKRRMIESRVDAPRRYLDALKSGAMRPRAYVSASAIGYYGTSDDATFTESNRPGSDFLAKMCTAWEEQAFRAQALGMRVAIVRAGIVLATESGALAAMLPPFRFGFGGKIGNGRQWLSWIHIADVVDLFLLAIDRGEGALNGTSPNPVTNAEFTHTLGAVLHRPTVLPTPTLALRAMLGEGADALLTGQRVVPQRALSLGFAFAYPQLKGALEALLEPAHA